MKRNIIAGIAIILAQCAIAQTPAELKAKLPAVKGWTVENAVETFDPNTLFERINGAAPGYLMYDFQELSVFVYHKDKSEDYITIQIYRHATPNDAFGIYASERPEETNFLDIGAEGYQEESILNFLADNLYVKIESPSSDVATVQAITDIARDFAKKINAKAALPSSLSSFPAANKVAHSEQFIAMGFLGHEFLQDAFTAYYSVDGKRYQVFLINAETTAAAKTLLDKYYAFTKQEGAPAEGRLTVKDRYNGDLECRWENQYVWGILNDGGAAINIDEVLDAVGKILK
ncbi:MAG: hypothetical protein LBS09_00695 [Bacteroidales bacterium]|jgi:hypothetical protein|nr:hypothetical protein [Bacteroidales bacterium]